MEGPTDFERTGIAAGAAAEMYACHRIAEEIGRRRAAIADPEVREALRAVQEVLYRQVGIYHLLIYALQAKKAQEPRGLGWHLREWWRGC